MSSDTIIATYNYYISSAQRTSGTPADFTIFLTTPLFLNGSIPSEFRFKLQYIQVPFSFSQFNQFNYTTDYVLTRNGIVYNGSFNIGIGNYNITSFLTEWISKLKSSLNALAGYNPLITATYSSDTNLCTFTLPADSFLDTAILFDNTTNKAVNLALGFNNDWTLLQNSTTTSQIDVNVSPSRNLFLLSDTLIQSKAFDAINTPISNTNILSIIPITVQPNQYISIYYNPPITSTLNNAVIDKLNFQLKDQSLNFDLVDFDLDYTLFFQIEEHRSFTSREIAENITNLRVGGSIPQSMPIELREADERREKLMRARGKLTGRLLKIKEELENKILPVE
jgi:hypothetical protein